MYDTYKNLTYYYEKYGNNKKSILILPGWGNTRETFYYLIHELQNKYSIYIVDYPGFGNTNQLKEEWYLEDYTEWIIDFIKRNGIHNPHIIAHSFGGRITSLLISKYHIKIDKVLLIDVAGIKRRKPIKTIIKEKIYKILKKCTYLFPPIKQEELRQKLLLYFSSEDYKNIPLSMQKTFQNIIKKDLRKYYKSISNETLLIWGEKDKDTLIRDGYYLNKIIKNSALIIYKGAEHFSYLNNPYLTLNIINNFFN